MLTAMGIGKLTINKVLLIDDDCDEHEIFKSALEQVAPHIELSCINSFFKKPANEEFNIPDLAFIDINMPKVSGFQWVKKLRDDGYSFPIVMFSTSGSCTAIETAFSLGANCIYKNR